MSERRREPPCVVSYAMSRRVGAVVEDDVLYRLRLFDLAGQLGKRARRIGSSGVQAAYVVNLGRA